MKKGFLVLLALAPLLLYGLITVAAGKGLLPTAIRKIYKYPNGDKIGHLVVMAIISFLVLLTVRLLLPYVRRLKGSIITILGLFALFTIEEFSQRYLPRRSFSLIDLYYSYGGTFIGITMATLLTLRKPKESLT